MGPNHEIDYKYLLDRMLSDKLSKAEMDELQEYIQHSYKDDELELLMRNHWMGLEDKQIAVSDLQILVLKNKILTQINQRISSPKKELQLPSLKWKNYLIRAAAVLFIPLLLGSLVVYYQMGKRLDQKMASSVIQRVEANPGSRIHFTLPDQTEVWLNSGSMLEFPLAMNEMDSRKVKLSGQGYFKVAHDKEHPFFVETNRLTVKALGTSFDVSDYSNDSQVTSTLEEGSVALIDLKGNEITRIHPGQKAIIDKVAMRLVVNDVDTRLTTSWKDGKLIFRNTSLPDVTAQLERWFNCKIHLDERLVDSGLKYTATIQDETLGEVLKMIEISTKIKTRIEKREVYINYRN
jgi:transmembrane sensor